MEIAKDKKQLDQIKLKQINEIKKLDKSKLFETEKKVKINFFEKLLIALGHERK